MRLWKITLLLLYLLLALSAWGRVFVRWSLADVPSAESLGVRELVVPSDARSAALMESARNHGYHVYTNVSLKQASEAAESVTKTGSAGSSSIPARPIRRKWTRASELCVHAIPSSYFCCSIPMENSRTCAGRPSPNGRAYWKFPALPLNRGLIPILHS